MQFGDGDIPRGKNNNNIDSESDAFQTYIQFVAEKRDYTKQQVKSVIYNETSRDTASDDPVVVRELRLSDPNISIDVPATNEDVSKGKRLFVNGTTNVGLNKGFIDITLSGQNKTVPGSILLRKEGTWNGSIRTKGLSPGTYTISAEIQGQTTRREVVIDKKGN
jgi:hypothetical protein